MGANGKNGGKLLVGIERITEYLGIGKPMFHELRRLQMPVRYHNGRWLASTDNLDEFARRFTLMDSSKIDVQDSE